MNRYETFVGTLFTVVIFLLIVLCFIIILRNKRILKHYNLNISNSVILRLIIAFAFAILCFVVSWQILKIMFGCVSVVFLLSMVWRSAQITMPQVVVIFFVIVIGLTLLTISTVGITLKSGFLSEMFFPNVINNFVDGFTDGWNSAVTSNNSFNFRLEDKRIFPDKEIPLDGVKNISIDLQNGLDLKFTSSDILKIPSELQVQKNGNRIIINNKGTEDRNSTYVIELGTDNLEEINIDSKGLKISGDTKLKNLKINSVGCKINATIYAAEAIEIDSAGLYLSGDLTGKELRIDCAGAKIDGKQKFDDITINSTGLQIGIKSEFSNLNLNTTGLSGSIEVLNPKERKGNIEVDSTGGILTIKNPNKADVEINTSGFVKLIRE